VHHLRPGKEPAESKRNHGHGHGRDRVAQDDLEDQFHDLFLSKTRTG
jgi:hypothetical protein